MPVSAFDLFKIGVGPSSSHTVGPMKAACAFATSLKTNTLIWPEVAAIRVDLYGSLALTGKGHGTDRAIRFGLEGESPDRIDPDTMDSRIASMVESGTIRILGEQVVPFREGVELLIHQKVSLPFHPNGMRFTARDVHGNSLTSAVYYSIGGGFIVHESEISNLAESASAPGVPFHYDSGDSLLAICDNKGITVSELMMTNERVHRTENEVRHGLLVIEETMRSCMERGFHHEGDLPGGLRVRRRAPAIYRELTSREHAEDDPLRVLDWVNLAAMAVNEENAGGGRVVTAPTNGAAGIIPAVLYYYRRFCAGANDDGVCRFLLAAAAIGSLYKENASISGAEVGCQGEVGVACSMAAAGLTEALGGRPGQVENAAEIGMEHNLGLTCDPVGGLVQIPCIERNAMGAVKAINAMRIAMQGDGSHRVSLDSVIKTMRQTGADMRTIYKETSLGGLAVNVVEC